MSGSPDSHPPKKPEGIDPYTPPASGSRSVWWKRSLGIRDIMVWVALLGILIRLGMTAGWGITTLLVVGLFGASIAALITRLILRLGALRIPMLWVIANSAEHRIPLEPGIEACGQLCGGRAVAKSRALIDRLHAGVPLAEAVEQVSGVLPTAGLVYLRMGWTPERLAQALRDLSRAIGEWRPYRFTFATRMLLLGWTLIMIEFIGFFFMYWIGPQFERILDDFGAKVPALTSWVIDFGSAIVGNPLWILGAILPLFILILLPLLYFDPMFWGIPLLDRVYLKRHGAFVMRLLAGEIGMNRPMSDALRTLESWYPGIQLKRRIGRVRSRTEEGAPWYKGLAEAGLIRRSDASVLEAAQHANNLEWALKDRAEAADRQAAVRMTAWSQAVFLVTVLAIGAAIGIFVVAYFYPLTSLISELTQW